jgi:two-component system, OmpR family, sensor histidine kinase BaeS
MRLTYKLFAAFLVTSLVIVGLMIAVMQYYASRNFSAYVGRVEMEQLRDILPRLEREYHDHQGWEHLRGNQVAWSGIMHLSLGLERESFPPPPRRRDIGPRDYGAPYPAPGPPQRRMEPGGREDSFNNAPPPHDIRPRLTLFDRNKRPVMGRGTTVEDHVLREIVVEGEVVGWLGLRIPDRISDPLQLDFLYRQTKALYLIGATILALAALLAYLFSRQLLRPVKQIARGAHALSSRRFDTRIDVHSSDELGQLSEDFNHMADTLERYEHLRRQWITDVSHELRTPLSVLVAEIDAVLDGVRDMNRETLESIQAEALLMTRLVEDLHTLSLLESDTLSMSREEVDVLKGVRDVLQAFSLKYSQKGITVESDLDRSGRIVVMGDKARLAQVFTNLLENTMKYTDAPGRLRIGHAVDSREMRLFFEDSPPGVNPDELPNIFERLYRTDRSRSRSAAGSGLGLAISKAIIEACGGNIVARPSTLGGLRVEITLPLKLQVGKNMEKRI